jgi:chromosome segregation ATPase
MKKLVTFILVGCLNGCSTTQAPADVAEQFWTAVQSRDRAAIETIATQETSAGAPTPDQLPIVTNFVLGRTLIDNDRASVATTVTASHGTVPLETKLVLDSGRWQVDYDATTSPLTRTSNLSEALPSVDVMLNKSIAEIKRALPILEQELQQIGKTLEDQLPELKQRLESFSKELENVIERLRESAERSRK